MTIFWFAQAIGIVALGFSIYSYQAKTREKLLTRQMHGAFAYILHYALLNAWTGMVIDMVVAVRNWVFVKKGKESWAKHRVWLYIFLLVPLIALPFVWEGWISLLPTLAMLVGVYVRWEGDAAAIRLGTFMGVLMWIPYTLYVESYAGTVSNLVILGTLIYSMSRNDGKRKEVEGIHVV